MLGRSLSLNKVGLVIVGMVACPKCVDGKVEDQPKQGAYVLYDSDIRKDMNCECCGAVIPASTEVHDA